jgi:hypothetical protein
MSDRPDAASAGRCEAGRRKGGTTMNVLMSVIVGVFVVGVLAVIAVTLFEMSPFAAHSDRYRDPVTGKRISDSPRLD